MFLPTSITTFLINIMYIMLFDLETHNYGDGILSVNIMTLYTKILLQEQDILINIMLLAIVSQDDRKKPYMMNNEVGCFDEEPLWKNETREGHEVCYLTPRTRSLGYQIQ